MARELRGRGVGPCEAKQDTGQQNCGKDQPDPGTDQASENGAKHFVHDEDAEDVVTGFGDVISYVISMWVITREEPRNVRGYREDAISKKPGIYPICPPANLYPQKHYQQAQRNVCEKSQTGSSLSHLLPAFESNSCLSGQADKRGLPRGCGRRGHARPVGQYYDLRLGWLSNRRRLHSAAIGQGQRDKRHQQQGDCENSIHGNAPYWGMPQANSLVGGASGWDFLGPETAKNETLTTEKPQVHKLFVELSVASSMKSVLLRIFA